MNMDKLGILDELGVAIFQETPIEWLVDVDEIMEYWNWTICTSWISILDSHIIGYIVIKREIHRNVWFTMESPRQKWVI